MKLDVDYQDNKNLLKEAKKEGVDKFIDISVFNETFAGYPG